MFEEPRDISLKQEDFENSAIIYDFIREASRFKNPNKDEILAEKFDVFIKNIISK